MYVRDYVEYRYVKKVVFPLDAGEEFFIRSFRMPISLWSSAASALSFLNLRRAIMPK